MLYHYIETNFLYTPKGRVSEKKSYFFFRQNIFGTKFSELCEIFGTFDTTL